MTRERWVQIKQILNSCREVEPARREDHLAELCGSDQSLVIEVKSFLNMHAELGDFLELPAFEQESGELLISRQGDRSLPSCPTEATPALPLGAKIGFFHILSPLGAGGMGEVYRAYDSKLGRDVALKTLPNEFSGDADRLARFRREARTLASLNHPNIAAIYGLEESGGVACLILELVEGNTLRGPLPIDKALEYARQITEALEAAHEKGIIHRDLKPANVKVTREGRVKVLDFGLAKAVWSAQRDQDVSQIPTLTQLDTLVGRIVGTPPYMSPEQARGKPVDIRTDVWAFGCLLYELLTGKRAFQGETLEDTIAAVLEREPDWSALPPPTPARIRELLRRCLQKDAGRRLQDAAQARRVIEEVIGPFGRVKRWQMIAVATIVLAFIAVGALFLFPPHRLPSRTDYLQITNFPDSVTQPALSPDGRMLTFVRSFSSFLAPGEIYIKMLPSGEPVQLTHDNLPKMSPVFSPDGSRIAYTALTGHSSWDTWVVPVLGGGPKLWLPNASGLVWTGPRDLMFSTIKSGEHMAIASSTEGGIQPRDIYVPPNQRGMAHRSYLSPDGNWVLLAEMDNGEWLPCRVVPFNGGSRGKPVGLPGAPCTNAAWSADGRWIYLSLHTGDNFHIWRQRFREGQPEQITSGATDEEGIAFSPDGHSLITSVGLRQRTVSFHNASGDRQISLEGYAYFPSLSPDGKKLYYRVLKGGTSPALGASELWVADIESGQSELLLPGFAVTGYNVSQDGRRIVFSALDSGRKHRLWVASTDHQEAPRQIPGIEGDMPYFGPSGELIFHAEEGDSTFAFRIREDGTGKRKLTSNKVEELQGVSPDRRFALVWTGAAVVHDSGGTQAVPFAGGSPIPICTGMCFLLWQTDGRLLFLSVHTGMQEAGASGRTYVVPLSPGQVFPKIPPGGFQSESEIAAMPGVHVIDAADVAPGPKPDVYAFSRQTVQRNLYRIPLP